MDFISSREKEDRKNEIKAKIEKVKERIWEVSLIDKFQDEDWKLYDKLHKELSDLKNELKEYDVIVDYDSKVYIKDFKLSGILKTDEIRLCDLISNYTNLIVELEKIRYGVNNENEC